MGGNRFRRLRRVTARIGLSTAANPAGAAAVGRFLLPARHARPRTVGRTVSGLIMLARHPRPDVRGTIAKDNTSSSFVLSQETDGVTIGEDQVRKIQDKDTAGRLCIDYLAQLVHIVGVKLTADGEHYFSAAGAMNFQHRPPSLRTQLPGHSEGP